MQSTWSANEASRLRTLFSYEILDTTPEPLFDNFAQLAETVCATPIVAIGFIDTGRYWFKSRIGFCVPEIEREISICAHTILQDDLLVVNDTYGDERFAANPLVTGAPGIRFYAGAPLIAPDGQALGTICVMDRRPRVLQPEQANALRALSLQVIDYLELRRQTTMLSRELSLQKKAARHESFYRELLEQAPDGIHSYDLQGNFLEVNSKLAEMLGYTRDELLRLNISDLIPLEDLATTPIRFDELLAGKALLTERRLCRKDGTLIDVEISGKRGESDVLHGVIRDVSERKRIDAALRESEEQFRQLAENISEVFWLSEAGKPDLIYVSPAYEEVWGRSLESLHATPSSWLDAVHAEDRQRIRKARAKQARGDYDEEYRVIRPDGSLRWVHDRGFPIKNAAGEVYRIAGVAADITKRKLAEAALRDSEERFFQAFNASPAPMTISRLTDNKFLFVNNSFLVATGYTSEEVIGRNTMDLGLWQDLQQREIFFHVLRKTGKVNRREVNFRSKSGEVRIGLLSAEVIEMPEERCILTLTIDITERRLAERRLAGQYAVTRVLTEAATVAEAAPQLLEAVSRSLDLTLGALWFINREDDTLSCVETWYDPVRAFDEFIAVSRQARFSWNTGFPGYVWANGAPLWIHDLATDTRFERAPIAAREGLHTAIGFPVRLGAEVLGVMEFFSLDVREFNENTFDMMSTIGNQIGQFVARKRAEEELQKTNAELEERVSRRTAQLVAANQVLEAEVALRTRAEEARGQLLRRLVGAHEEERRRIARELHDNMSQHLTALDVGLDSIKEGSQDQPEIIATVERLSQITDELARDVHHLAWELRPAALDDVGLQSALANYLTQWSKRTEVLVDFHSDDLDKERLSPEIETTIYRVVQEALTNVMKHAQSRHVSIILKSQAHELQAIIEDDGKGFKSDCVLNGANPQKRLGLIGMQERVAMLAGTLEIESTPGRGTTVFIRIPISLAARGAPHD